MEACIMIRVQVPATTANLGPGFDTLGMALQLYNFVEMEEIDQGLQIEVEGEGWQFIPLNDSNLVIKVADMVFKRVRYQPKGLRVRLINNVPVASGLGSSATAIVGGLVAANVLSGNKLSRKELLVMATSLEGHPDNVAPALLGGLVVSAVVDGDVKYIKINPPVNMRCVVATPEFPLSTKKAREVLPHQVSMSDAVFNISRTALLVSSLMQGDLTLMSVAMDDRLHQPYRCSLIPGMKKVFAAVKLAGAKGVALSGAGPTLIAFTAGGEEHIVKVMKDTFKESGVKCRVRIVDPTPEGASWVAYKQGVAVNNDELRVKSNE